MRPFNEPIISNALMNANISSPGIPLAQTFGYAIQAVYTGTPTGTLKLQASNDPLGDLTNPNDQPTNWEDISNSSQSISAAGSFLWNVTDVMYTWVRLVFTDGSGGTSTARLSANINGKGV